MEGGNLNMWNKKKHTHTSLKKENAQMRHN